MHYHVHNQLNVTFSRDGQLHRRSFLRCLPAAALAAGSLDWRSRLAAQASQLRTKKKACILLWMQGGPSQFETLSPKPGHASGGETSAIATSVPGIQIAEHLPAVASAMDDICLIRSMNSKEGSHPRASYLMHTGYIPTASIKHPTIGSHVAHQLGNPESDLPDFVRIGRVRSGGGGGLLGVNYNPFVINNANRTPDNTAPGTSTDRYLRRLSLLGQLHDEYESVEQRQEVKDHRKVYGKASRMVLSSNMKAFDIAQEPAGIRQQYGSSEFAAGCLMARRLIETGVTFVEVAAGNWDTHQDNFSRSAELCGQVDKPFAFLLEDLKQRGLLEQTLVVWMGEFGRTPRINPRAGRDHYPRAYSVALAGAGVRGGQVIGTTDPGGVGVEDRPVGVSDLLRTIFGSLEIDSDLENMSGVGRPIAVVDGGELVKEVFSG
jgi:hypothetical protein